MSSAGGRARGPLDGLRVVDFCWVLAGPLGTRILADFGADVMRVESLARPDGMRSRPRPAAATSMDHGYWFNDVNAGKRSLALDLSTSRGREVALDLIAASDVVTNNFRPGVLDRLGLVYDAASARNDGVIYLHLPGCGPEGPWAQRATMGGLLTAAGGFNTSMGFHNDPPYGFGVAFPDFTSPFLLASSVLAAVEERARTGRGREIQFNQLSSVVSLLGPHRLDFASNGDPGLRRNRDPNYCPHGVYRTAEEDRWIAIAVETDAEWLGLTDVMGRRDLGEERRYATRDGRQRDTDAIDAAVEAWTRTQDRFEAADRLQGAGVPAAAVADIRDTVENDPQLRSHWQRVEQPGDPGYTMWLNGQPIRINGEPQRLRRAPTLGEHSEAALRERLGMSDAEFNRLVAEQVVW